MAYIIPVIHNFFEYILRNPFLIVFGLIAYCLLFAISLLFGGKKGKNPFSISHVKPIKDVVIDQNARDKVLKQRFKPNKIPENLDAIVIGSGVGGLTVASLMSHAGKRVLVLEQHDQAGGCCHTFVEKGFEFDTGIHYIGKMYEGNQDRILADQITGGGVDYPLMDDVFDTVNIGVDGKYRKYNIYGNRESWKKQLNKEFPDEGEAIDKIFEHMKASRGFMRGFFSLKYLPKFLSKILVRTGLINMISKNYTLYSTHSTQEILDSVTDNQELKTVICYPFGDYGVVPSKSPFGFHSILLNHYMKGAYYIRGGPSEFVYHTIPQVEKTGGRVLVQAPVSKIILKNGRACGVTVQKGDSAIDIYAKKIISTAGINVTFNKLLPKEIATKSCIYPSLSRVGSSLSYMSVFVGLDGSSQELGIKAQNMWSFTSNKVEEDTEKFLSMSVEDVVHAKVPLLFVSFPSAKDPTWEKKFPGKSTCLIITLGNWEWFEAWEGEKVKHRGQSYEDLKNTIGRQAWNQVQEIFPLLQGKEEYFEVGSPLSNKHYLGYEKGEIYGLDHVRTRFDPSIAIDVRPKTDIPNLYLSGQDALTCGFTGAMFGGLLCASSVLNRDLVKDLGNLEKEMQKRAEKKRE